VLHYLGARPEVNIAACMERSGISREMLAAPSARVDAQYLAALWQTASHATSDEQVGLNAGATTGLYCSGLLSPLLRTSPTLGHAIQTCARFLPLCSGAIQLRVNRTVEGHYSVAVSWGDPSQAERARHDVECFLASVVFVTRAAASHEWRPEHVRFAHNPPRMMSTYEQVFGCPVAFGGTTELLIRAEDWDRALPNGHEAFHRALAEYSNTRLSELEPQGLFMLRVRCAVEPRLERGDTEVDTIAKVVAVSPRTLQRRLQQKGTTLRGVIESVRQQRAFELLGKSRMSLPAIASTLSFSCASAFHRAFKRWTGGTPTRFRRCYN
jgi:AraC-like DNA-binding protein